MSIFTVLKSGLKKPVRVSPDDYKAKMESRLIDPDTGHPVPDPTPMAPPIGYKKQPSMVEIVREMVRSERLRQEAMAAGHETFEEADDFDVDDDPPDLKSGWENDFDPPIRELTSAGAAEVSRKEKETKAKQEKEASSPKPSEAPTEGGAGGTQSPKR